MGDSAYSNLASATTPAAQPYIDNLAVAETPIKGSVTGSYTATQANDGVYETIAEKLTGGRVSKRYSELAHQWTFNVAAGSSIDFYANAYRSASPAYETFKFWYSTNGVSFTDMPALTATSDGGAYFAYTLPFTTAQTVYIRLTDTDHFAGHTSIGTVVVDHLLIRSTLGGVPVAPSVAAGAVAPAESSVSVAALSLLAVGSRVNGAQVVDLSWSGATSPNVLVKRTKGTVTVESVTINDGAETDAIGARGTGTYVYTLCESAAPTVCSAPVTVTF